jgi:hypothetical protein
MFRSIEGMGQGLEEKSHATDQGQVAEEGVMPKFNPELMAQ